jgi:hypothetical protein
MANYSTDNSNWKLTKNLFFHLLDITIPNSHIVYKTCGGSTTHMKVREQLVRDFVLS